ncbi:MAG: AsmA-like C-terminal region-containing protein [Candidatus Acidiferrales bacterium]
MSKRKWIILGTIVGVLVLAAVVTLYFLHGPVQRIIRNQTIAYLKTRFHSDVEIQDFQVSLRPNVHVVVTGVVLRHNGRTDIPPLVEIRRLTLDASLLKLLGKKINVSSVRLEGLQIRTPPRGTGGQHLFHATDTDLAAKYPVVIDEILADDAILLPLPKDPKKTPNPFSIHHLDIENFRFDQPAHFHAILTNPKPLGEIDCVGLFGPWNAEEPSATPVDAKFSFSHADFRTLKGLSGFLSSQGTFKGPLDYLEVEGATDMPDFALRTASHPLALHTDYSAIVDGTNGNVILKKVTATFLNTIIVAQGEVVDLSTAKGRTVNLNAVSQKSRVEDLLTLAVKADKPSMTGSAKLNTKILIPESDEDVIERMTLDGQFAIGEIRFTNEEIQDKIDTLSHKAQGKPQLGAEGTQLSEFRGKFTMANGVVKFSNLSFGVEGASLSMAGTYSMDSGQLDFHGKLRMNAKLSQTVTGTKSVFLKVVDPFFRKNGMTEIPIKITGTKDEPKYGLDLHDPGNQEPSGGGAKE